MLIVNVPIVIRLLVKVIHKLSMTSPSSNILHALLCPPEGHEASTMRPNPWIGGKSNMVANTKANCKKQKQRIVNALSL